MTILDEFVGRDGDWLSLSGAASVSPRGSSGVSVLLVTEDAPLSVGNRALRDLLVADGYEVTIRWLVDDEDYTGIDVVVMSYGNPSGDNGKYVNPPVGIVGVDTWRPIGMGNLAFANNVNAVEVVDAASPLAGGVSGTFAPYLSSAYITWSTDLSASPDVVVTRPGVPGQAVVFGYEAGSDMLSRFATTRHVALGYHADGLVAGLTANARAQLYAAVEWARASAYVAPAVPAAPTGLAAVAQNAAVSLSWTASQYADSYTVKRATVTGGPYTDIQSGLLSTTFTDTGLTNATEYFYVVSATNGSGESANSAQVSATPAATAAPTTLSLHVTSEELTIWRSRWTDGVAADAFLNTRVTEEKARLTSHADTVAGNINGHLWQIGEMTTDSQGRFTAIPGNLSTSRNQGGRLMNAGLAALITENATRMNQIGSILHLQPDQTRCNFASNPGWAYKSTQMRDASTPGYGVSHMVIQHMHAYSYHQAAVAEGWATDLTSTQHTKIRAWYKAWADYNLDGLEVRLNQAFNGGWTSGNYSSYTTGLCNWCFGPIYDGGPAVYGLHDRFNNRFARTVQAIALAGILLDNAHLKERAWRATRDFMVYSVFPQGAIADNQRAFASSAARWTQAYIILGTSHVMSTVDAFARDGDPSLYQLETTSGALGTAGTPSNTSPNDETAKSFRALVRAVGRYGNQTYSRYANGERINFRGPFTTNFVGKGSIGAHDSWIFTNLFYQDTGISKDWYRGENGQPTWEIHGNGSTDLNDAWAFPAPYLMWAGLEGQVWPFPGVAKP